MRRQLFFGLISLVILPLLIISLGCSTLDTLGQDVTSANDTLKRRVMVLSFIDQAGIGPEKTEQTTKDFRGFLGNSSRLLIYEPPKNESVPLDAESLELGVVTSPKLVKEAKDLGMVALITGLINPIDISIKDTGFWPFNKSRKSYEISTIVNVVDTFSGALLLTRLESEEVFVPLEEDPDQSEKELINQLWIEALPRILKLQAAAVISVLTHEPWKGEILAVDNEIIRINAGEEVGLRHGQHLEVFANGESISTEGGRSFEIPGDQIGEIVVDSVMERDSLAAVVEGGPFSVGQVIKLKP
jgi:hypothetical protein